jgi:hypothetical protein
MKQRERLFDRVIKSLAEAANEEKITAEKTEKTKAPDDMQEGWESLVIDEKERNKKLIKDKKSKKDKSEVSDMFLDYVHGKKPVSMAEVEKQWKHNKANNEGEGYGMAMASLKSIAKNISDIFNSNKEIDTECLNEPWVQSKITLAEDYIKSVHDYLLYYEEKPELEDETEDEDEASYDTNVPEYFERPADNTLPGY